MLNNQFDSNYIGKQIRTVIPLYFLQYTSHFHVTHAPKVRFFLLLSRCFILFLSDRHTKGDLVSSLQYRKSMRLNDDTGNFIGLIPKIGVCD